MCVCVWVGHSSSSLTVSVDVEGRRKLLGGYPGQSTLLRGLLSDSFRCLRLPTSVAHPAQHRWKHCSHTGWRCKGYHWSSIHEDTQSIGRLEQHLRCEFKYPGFINWHGFKEVKLFLIFNVYSEITSCSNGALMYGRLSGPKFNNRSSTSSHKQKKFLWIFGDVCSQWMFCWPWHGDLRLLLGDVCGLLSSFHSPVHLLSDLTRPQWDQVLAFAAHQHVLLVLSFLLGAVGEGGASVPVPLVSRPLTFVMQAVRAPAHAPAGPLVAPPLASVHFCDSGVHRSTLLTFTGVGVDVGRSRADGAHAGLAAEGALLAELTGQRAFGLRAPQLQAAQDGLSEAAFSLPLAFGFTRSRQSEPSSPHRAPRQPGHHPVCGRGGAAILQHSRRAVAVLGAERVYGCSQREEDDGRHAVRDTLPHAIAMTHPTEPLALVGSWETNRDRARVRTGNLSCFYQWQLHKLSVLNLTLPWRDMRRHWAPTRISTLTFSWKLEDVTFPTKFLLNLFKFFIFFKYAGFALKTHFYWVQMITADRHFGAWWRNQIQISQLEASFTNPSEIWSQSEQLINVFK